MARLGVGAVIAACAIAGTGCSGGDSAPKDTTTAAIAAHTLRERIEFKRSNGGQAIGSITFLEVAALPADCLFDPAAGPGIAVLAEVVNYGETFLPKPDIYGLAVVDQDGVTQKVQSLSVRLACESRFPAIAPSRPSGKTNGWALLQIREPNPSALVYTPTVGEPDSTAGNLRLVAVEPKSATIALTSPQQISTTPLATTPPPTPPQQRTAPPAAPSAGVVCDPAADRWATDSAGSQLRCALPGGPVATWVESLPFIGTRTPGTPCDLGVAVAESPDGEVMVCVGEQGSSTWLQGP